MQTWIFPKPPGSFFMHQLISSDICANLLGWCGIFEFHCLDDNCLGEPSEFGVRFFSFFQSLLQKQRRFVLAQQTCISVNIPVACHFVMFGTPGRGDQPNVQFLGFPRVGKAKSKESSFFFEKSTVNTGLGFGSVILPPQALQQRRSRLKEEIPAMPDRRPALQTPIGRVYELRRLQVELQRTVRPAARVEWTRLCMLLSRQRWANP